MSSALPFALFEDNLGQAGQARLLHTLRYSLSCRDAQQLTQALAEIETWRAAGLWVALAAHYELGLALEPRLQARLPPGTPLLRAWAFAHSDALHGPALDRWWQAQLDALSPQARSAGILDLAPGVSADEYQRSVQTVLDLIAQGDCYQVNLTFPLTGRYFGHPLALFAELRQRQPVAHGVLLHSGTDWVLSRSPELFVAREGERLRCRPMKGTVARTPQTTPQEAEALLLSAKNQAENLMIVDLIRNDLGRLAPPGGVRVDRLFEVEAYRSLYQLTSTVEAAPVRADLPTVLNALFPCGSVTGAPKIRAMEIIAALERGPRGLYCGGLGWLAPDGDFSLNVPIRTLLCETDGRCRLDVGSGIVADSEPLAEHAESLAKARFATELRDELRLIETLRYAPDEVSPLPLRALHLARLRHSAAELGFAYDENGIGQALDDCLATLPAQPHRLRLSLARDGRHELSWQPLSSLPGEQAIAFAHDCLDSTDPRLRHKTSARGFYDEALRGANQAGLFDLLFRNERGELCEGARSNLFLELDGEWLTPALSSGLLPGVLRASLLAAGRVREAVIQPRDLHAASRIWMGNALRGLVPVSLRQEY